MLKFQPRDGASPLRSFIALPNDSLLVLGARRSPPIIAPAANPNTNTTVSVCTSVGFRSLKPEEYAQAAETLKPDVVVALGDIPYGRALGSKRIEKATDRSIQWVQDHIALRKSANTNGMQSRGRLFASMLPVSCEKQQFYVDLLSETVADEIAGLALHSLDTLDDLPDSLAQLPRIGFSSVDTPQEILQHASRGLDIVTVHFVSAATDAGIALHFTFPPPITEHGQAQAEFLPLGIDMWSSTHAIDIAPLAEKCDCYACTNHHRAYVQHLLMAKEMLGWTLLQIHNHWVVDSFFAGIRQSLERDTFQQDLCNFQRLYAKHLPEKTGKGPRYVLSMVQFVCWIFTNYCTECEATSTKLKGRANRRRTQLRLPCLTMARRSWQMLLHLMRLQTICMAVALLRRSEEIQRKLSRLCKWTGLVIVQQSHGFPKDKVRCL